MGGRKNPEDDDAVRRPDGGFLPDDDSPDPGREAAEKVHVHGPHCGCGHDHAGAGDRRLPDFPTEVAFKAVFRNRPFTMETLRSICREAGIDAGITDRVSRNGTFISYTITAVFPSDEVLKTVCSRVGSVEGFYTMF